MVCNRCIMVAKQEIGKLDLHPVDIRLGEVDFENELDKEQKKQISDTLMPLGFELIDDKKGQTIEKIKTLVRELVHGQDGEMKKKLSDILRTEIHHDYNYLSNLFSEVEGITIEKYYIEQRVERVKELLVYDELSLSEIAFQLNYSSVAYLSNQFKKVTGLTPSHFKKIRAEKRRPVDEV